MPAALRAPLRVSPLDPRRVAVGRLLSSAGLDKEAWAAAAEPSSQGAVTALLACAKRGRVKEAVRLLDKLEQALGPAVPAHRRRPPT